MCNDLPSNNALDTHSTIRIHWSLVKRLYPTVKEFQIFPLICYKRPKSIRDKLIKADIGRLTWVYRQQFLWTWKCKTFLCLSWSQCSNVIKVEYFTYPHTGLRYYVKDYVTCDPKYVVYLLKYPCGLIYVRETTQCLSGTRLQNLTLSI